MRLGITREGVVLFMGSRGLKPSAKARLLSSPSSKVPFSDTVPTRAKVLVDRPGLPTIVG